MASICLKVWERVLSVCLGLGYVRSFGALSRVRVSGVFSVTDVWDGFGCGMLELCPQF